MGRGDEDEVNTNDEADAPEHHDVNVDENKGMGDRVGNGMEGGGKDDADGEGDEAADEDDDSQNQLVGSVDSPITSPASSKCHQGPAAETEI